MKMAFHNVRLPRFARIEQRLSGEHIADVRKEVCEKVVGGRFLEKVKPGARIAITAGSRGMGGFVELLNGICDAVRRCGAEPFLVPAMGSHGGATAEGQRELLRALGVTDEAVPAAIRATMETVSLGSCKTGAVAHLDRIVAEADGAIVLGRVKTHPENTEGIASGLLKMTTVGLGKQAGAQEAHSHGLWPSVTAVPELTLATQKVLCGVAVVENAFRRPVRIEVVPGRYDAFVEADRRLLNVAKEHFARIPFESLDVLVLDEIGKNISGTGMDLNVVGKWRLEGGEHKPNYSRIVVCSLTQESCGNGLGIGLADFTTERFVQAYEAEPTVINMMTATEPGALNTREAALPVVAENDRAAMEMAVGSALALTAPRICRVRNTALLHQLDVSEALLDEVRKRDEFRVMEEARELEFEGGELIGNW